MDNKLLRFNNGSSACWGKYSDYKIEEIKGIKNVFFFLIKSELKQVQFSLYILGNLIWIDLLQN